MRFFSPLSSCWIEENAAGPVRFIILLLFLGAVVPSQASERYPMPDLHHLVSLGARVSARVIDLETGHTLTTINPAQALIPASVTKLYTSAAALDRWGAAKRFVTRVMRQGNIQGGVLHGNLVLMGGGDPDLTNAQLWTLAQRVRNAGIHSVTGHLVVEAQYFGPVPCVTSDRCQAAEVSRDAYNAPLSSAGVDYSNACLSVSPGPYVGAPAHLAFEPFDIPMLTIRGHINTLPAGHGSQIEVVRHNIQGREVFEVSGSISKGVMTQRFYRSVAAPDRFAGEVFRAFLLQAGIKVHGRVTIIPAPGKPSPVVTVAQVKGTPLGELLRGMMVYSNNYMADTLALDWAVAVGASVPVTLTEVGKRLTAYAQGIDATSPYLWAQDGAPLIKSGSGLTVGNRLSANDVTALLAHEYHHYADFPAFLAGLTVPDQSPVIMLKGEDGAWNTRIAAKTGSLDQPVSVFALAGYVRLRHGHWGAFAVLVNGSDARPHIGLFKVVSAVRSDLGALLIRDLSVHQ